MQSLLFFHMCENIDARNGDSMEAGRFYGDYDVFILIHFSFIMLAGYVSEAGSLILHCASQT